MQKENKLGSIERSRNVPQLRFPEFEGEWMEKVFSDILLSSRLGGNYSNSLVENDFPLIKMGNIDRGKIKLDKIEYIDPSETIDKKDRIKKGDLFFNTRNTLELVGKVAIWNNELPIAYYNSNLMFIKFDNNYFMNYRLNSFQGIKELRKIATGTTSVAAIYSKDLFKIKLLIPSLPEQQKIADFLTAVDSRLQSLEKKKSLLEEYKKGVMQQIFKQELRFKPALSGAEVDEDGKEFSKWQIRRMDNFLSIPEKVSPKTIDVSKILTVKLHLKGIHLNDRTDGLKIGATNYIKRRQGQFIYGKQNLFNGAFGIVPVEFDGFVSSGDVPALDVDNKIINSSYFYYFLSRTSYYKSLENIASGSGSKRIHEKTFLKLKIKVPCLKEQTKIANFLSAIDKKIELVAQQIEKTKIYKKGLLQHMFV